MKQAAAVADQGFGRRRAGRGLGSRTMADRRLVARFEWDPPPLRKSFANFLALSIATYVHMNFHVNKRLFSNWIHNKQNR